ncbi:hypothetical protein ACQCLI_22400 [Pseudomonas nitroreducens]|uniref:hypothetical protein n=1 Tax=Pseudomonas TaxID=286 RepID=UPI00037E0A52|nr:hypothetical protein [Pseudomonas nitroreducens]
MIKQLLTATAVLVAVTVQAEPHDNCITSELEDRLITADLAVAAGNCHLGRASDESQAVSALGTLLAQAHTPHREQAEHFQVVLPKWQSP